MHSGLDSQRQRTVCLFLAALIALSVVAVTVLVSPLAQVAADCTVFALKASNSFCMLEKNVPSERAGPWSLKARELMDQADTRLTPRARQAWRWRILYLRSQVDAQLYLSRGVMQGRVLYDAFQELTRIYHAQNAEPAVKPPQVDPTEPPVTVHPVDFHGPELAETYGRAVLASKPMAYWRKGNGRS